MSEHSSTVSPVIQSVQIEDITIPTGRRQHTDKQIRALAQSIEAVGQLQPIGLTEDYRLIFGAGRIAACQQLGFATVWAALHSLGGLEAELAEIHENLHRSALTGLEQIVALKRGKELYETLYPETKRGAQGRRGSGQGETVLESDKPSFSEDVAAKTGRSRRSVERDVALAAEIPADVAAQVAGTQVADNKAELGRLAKLPKAQQRRVAGKLAAGEAKTVAEAVGGKATKDPVAEAKKVLGQLIHAMDLLGLVEDFRASLQAIKDRLRKMT